MKNLILFLKPRTYNLKPRFGYTLIELLVAMSVFVIITSIAIGGYVRGIRTSRQAAALASANSNVASALEQMMREMRVGFAFTSCSDGCIEFRNLPAATSGSKIVTYKLENERITRSENNTDPNPITDDNVKVSSASFSLIKNPNHPDKIVILLGVKTNEARVDGGVINLQTTISARN